MHHSALITASKRTVFSSATGGIVRTLISSISSCLPMEKITSPMVASINLKLSRTQLALFTLASRVPCLYIHVGLSSHRFTPMRQKTVVKIV